MGCGGGFQEPVFLQALETELGLRSLFVQLAGEFSPQENESNPSPITLCLPEVRGWGGEDLKPLEAP